MTAPTFLGIGAQKAGTTWLFGCIARHPRVLTPPDSKEVHFFDRPANWARGRDWYESRFPPREAGDGGACAIGEFTPDYLWTRGAPALAALHRGGEGHLLGTAERVADAYGPATGHELRLLLSLRHPVDRALSSHNQAVKLGYAHPDSSALEASRRFPGIVERGFYARDLEAWFARFPREAFHIMVYEEDIVPDAAKARTLRRCFAHIGVDDGFVPDGLLARPNSSGSAFETRRRNASGLRRRLLERVPDALRGHRLWDLPKHRDDAAALWERYAPDVRHLERLLGRSLPWQPPAGTTATGSAGAGASRRP